MSIKFLAGLIITLMVFIIMLFSVHEITKLIKEDSKVELCRTSVIRASKASEFSFESSKYDKYKFADCKRVNLGLLKIKNNSQGRRKLAKIVVDEFHDCWYKFGEGKLNPNSGSQLDQHVSCYICSSFQVNNDFLSFNDDLDTYFKAFDDKLDFLKTSFVYNSNGKIYYSLRQLYSDDDKISNNELLKSLNGVSLDLRKGHKYNIVATFIIDQDKTGWWYRFLYDIGTNKYKTESKIAIVDETDLGNVCYSLEN